MAYNYNSNLLTPNFQSSNPMAMFQTTDEANDGSLFNTLFNSSNNNTDKVAGETSLLGGAGGTALGLAKTGVSIWNAYNASKMLSLAEGQMDFQKNAYNQNTALQAQSINTQLEDRQNARNKDSTNNAISTEDFMKLHRVNTSTL
ncbi:MAG: hypothetical protein DRP64_07910 [Verrucomicrobia bacterium]|nr:MAG: hypothetical protein DRP64_07910 [Verrucomicrobiota bacterium]